MCDASTGSLSSYSYIILLIHYLQQAEPPVVPVLQQVGVCLCVCVCVCVCVVYVLPAYTVPSMRSNAGSLGNGSTTNPNYVVDEDNSNTLYCYTKVSCRLIPHPCPLLSNPFFTLLVVTHP